MKWLRRYLDECSGVGVDLVAVKTAPRQYPQQAERVRSRNLTAIGATCMSSGPSRRLRLGRVSGLPCFL